MSINLEQYRIFCTVAKMGSMSEAARQLYLTQPAITQAIKQLEQNLGGPLFVRGARGVSLTREGELMLDYVQRALGLIETAEQRFLETHGLRRGQIHIGASDSICKHFLLHGLEQLHETYPGLEIHVTNRTSPETVALVKRGEAEIGFVNLPIEPDGELVVRPCREVHDCFVAGPKYFGALESIDTLEVLAGEPILMLERMSNMRRRFDAWTREKGMLLQPVIELGSLDLLTEFAKIGLGIALVIEEFVQPELRAGTLRKVALREELPSRQIGLIYLRKASLSPAADYFAQMIFEEQGLRFERRGDI